ncbi:MAG: hypothetical protein ACOCQA_02175 [bacterium]
MTRTASYELESPFPCEIKNGENIIINMDMAPPKDGWNNQGKLRLQGVNSLKDFKFSVVFNDCSLQKTNDVSEPYSNSYINHGQNKILNGKKEDWQSWILPVKLAVNGNNKIEIKLEQGTNVSLIFLDVAIS